MAKDVEKLELMFRRQIAIESSRSPKRPVVYRLDPVGPKGTDAPTKLSEKPRRACHRLKQRRPLQSLLPSIGYFNAARVPAEAPTWMFLVGGRTPKQMDALIATLVNVQSSKRAFRPIFILDDSQHLELLRTYGFSFEVICSRDYRGQSRSEQIELLKLKWGSVLTLDLDSLQTEELQAAAFR